MERRTFDAPMDFEYDNKSGQIPANSPWMSGARNHHQSFQGLSSKLAHLASCDYSICNDFPGLNMAQDANAMRTSQGQDGDSPSSSSNFSQRFVRSIHNVLIEPALTWFGTGYRSNNLPQTPLKSHIANFRDNPSLDFSSGAENPSSPENADTEATPDVSNDQKNLKDLSENVTVFRGNHSPSKPQPSSIKATSRLSLSNYFGIPSRFSPSHKQLVRADKSSRGLTRPTKRKRHDLKESSHHRDPSSDSDYYEPRTSSPREPSRGHTSQPVEHSQALLPSVLTFIHAHPNLPNILSWYAQMILSTLVLCFLSYIVYTFYRAIQADVSLKVDELSRDIMASMAQCAEDFKAHKCAERSDLGGSFKKLCDEWGACMNQDYKAVGLARISAQTWAEILNGFVEPLSYKILGIMFVGVALIVSVPSLLFGFIRKKEAQWNGGATQSAGQAYSGFAGMGGMQSPQRQPSQQGSFDGGFASGMMDCQFYTPSHSRSYDAIGGNAGMGMATGRRMPSNDMMEGWRAQEVDDAARGGSPVKRIGYR